MSEPQEKQMPAGRHDWTARPGDPRTFCRKCLVIQRADGQNKPCPGPVRIGLRGK